MRSVLDILTPAPAFSTLFGQESPTIKVTDENVVVEFDVPGLEAEDLTLEIKAEPIGRSILLLSGSRETESGALRQVNRAVLVPSDVSEETASAKLANGVLTVTLERTAKKDRRTIQITS